MTTKEALKQLKKLKHGAQCDLMCSYDVENTKTNIAALSMAITLLENTLAKESGEAVEIEVVLTAYVQTSFEEYTHVYKTVPITILDDGNEWHVAGEGWRCIGDE